MGISIDISNLNDVTRGMKDCQCDMAKGARRTMLDLGKRGVHTVVRSEVTKVYNIKKKDLGGPRRYDEVGSISLAGISIPIIEIKYMGRPLTPVHFAMTPKTRPGKRYTVKWKPFRAGGKEALKGDAGFPAFLTGNSPAPLARTQAHTWVNGHRTPVNAAGKIHSVPSMIEDGKVSPNIENEIMNRMAKGFGRYCK